MIKNIVCLVLDLIVWSFPGIFPSWMVWSTLAKSTFKNIEYLLSIFCSSPHTHMYMHSAFKISHVPFWTNLFPSLFYHQKKVYLLYIDKPLSSSASCSSAAFSSSFCLEDICEHWTKEFQLHSISEPETSAELIAAHVLGLKTVSVLFFVCIFCHWKVFFFFNENNYHFHTRWGTSMP